MQNAEVRPRTRVYARLSQRAITCILAILGAFTYFPALRSPRFLDDYLHTLMIEGRFPVARSPFNLYDFVSDVDRTLFADRGLLPWWAHPELKLRFFRPLASALLWFEQRVLGFGVELQHLHSFAWWLVCVLAARALFRRLLPDRPALLATLVFSFAPCHAMPLAWVANRNALLSLAFGTLALSAYLEWRTRPGHLRGLGSTALFALALLSGEYALCFAGYVVALELTRRGDSLSRRALGLLPFAAPAVAYLWVRRSFDYGTAGSGFYVDPLEDPWGFVAVAPFRLAALLGQGWLTIGTDTWIMSGRWRYLVFPCVIAAAVVLALLLRQVYAQLPSELRDRAAALLLGSVLAIIPVLSTVPSPRLMGIALLGIAVNVALLLDRAWFPDALSARSRAAEHMGVAAALLGFLHFVHGPVTAWLAAAQIQRDAGRFVTDVAWVGKRLHELGTSDVVVLRGGVDAFFGPFALVVQGGPWSRWDILSDPGHLLTLRRDAQTLDLITPPDTSLTPTGGFSLFRESDTPMRAGQEHRTANFTLQVLSVSQAGPRRARITFHAPIDQGRQLWVSRRDERLHETPPPAVGRGLPSDR